MCSWKSPPFYYFSLSSTFIVDNPHANAIVWVRTVIFGAQRSKIKQGTIKIP
jgi:hypothetical protein